MSEIRVNKMAKLNTKQKKEYFEQFASKNPYFHHIHVLFGDQVFTLSHDTGFLTADQLLAVLQDIGENYETMEI